MNTITEIAITIVIEYADFRATIVIKDHSCIDCIGLEFETIIVPAISSEYRFV